MATLTHRYVVTLAVFLQVVGFTAAQTKGELRTYARSSLATMMVYHSEDEFGKDIFVAFDSIPTPDKYDDHNLNFRVLMNDSIKGVQRKKDGLIKAEYGKALSSRDVQK
nr:hypothetical protein [Paludibacteraceae bacterium]